MLPQIYKFVIGHFDSRFLQSGANSLGRTVWGEQSGANSLGRTVWSELDTVYRVSLLCRGSFGDCRRCFGIVSWT